MAVVGVSINGTNTLTTYGLFLCADLKIGEPKLKENRVDIPGGDGSLNMSYSPQGWPVYYDREITFSLAKRMNESDRSTNVSTIRNLWHGKEVDLILPNDTTHYWHGVITFGDISGYNAGVIPVKMTADPYKYKLTETVVYANAGNQTNLYPYYDDFEGRTNDDLYYAKSAELTATVPTSTYAKHGDQLLRLATADSVNNAYVFIGSSTTDYGQVACSPGKYVFSFYGRNTSGSVAVRSRMYGRKYRGSSWSDSSTYVSLGVNETTFSGDYVRVEIPITVTEAYPYVCLRLQVLTANTAVLIDCCQLEKVADNVTTASTWAAHSDTTGTVTATLTNGERRPVVPYITASDPATLAWSGNSVSISSGANIRIPQLVLQSGSVSVSVTSAGLVSFAYQEGSL